MAVGDHVKARRLEATDLGDLEEEADYIQEGMTEPNKFVLEDYSEFVVEDVDEKKMEELGIKEKLKEVGRKWRYSNDLAHYSCTEACADVLHSCKDVSIEFSFQRLRRMKGLRDRLFVRSFAQRTQTQASCGAGVAPVRVACEGAAQTDVAALSVCDSAERPPGATGNKV